MVNRNRPHVLVIPEDEANSRIVNGFHLDLDPTAERQLQVLPEAGGWTHVLEVFESTYVPYLDRCAIGHLVLLIDFDKREDRLVSATARIPQRLRDRVFILGCRNEPKNLKGTRLGCILEDVGMRLAEDCRNETDIMWGCAELRHNAPELARMREVIRPILFPEA